MPGRRQRDAEAGKKSPSMIGILVGNVQRWQALSRGQEVSVSNGFEPAGCCGLLLQVASRSLQLLSSLALFAIYVLGSIFGTWRELQCRTPARHV